jgi:hypothetical protein
VGGALRALVDDYQRRWDLLLEPINFAYRVAVIDREGFSPFELLQGRTPRVPLDVLFGDAQPDRALSFLQDIWERLRWSRECYRNANALYTASQAKIKQRYDAGRRAPSSIALGDLVALRRPPMRKGGLSSKMINRWRGPLEVVWLKEQSLKVRHMGSGRVFSADAEHVFPYPAGHALDAQGLLDGELLEDITDLPLHLVPDPTSGPLPGPPMAAVMDGLDADGAPVVVGDLVILAMVNDEFELVKILDTDAGDEPGESIEVHFFDTHDKIKGRKTRYAPAYLDKRDGGLVLTFGPMKRYEPWTQLVPASSVLLPGMSLTKSHHLTAPSWKRFEAAIQTCKKPGYDLVAHGDVVALPLAPAGGQAHVQEVMHLSAGPPRPRPAEYSSSLASHACLTARQQRLYTVPSRSDLLQWLTTAEDAFACVGPRRL